jgi:hypothetical protein
MTREMIRVEKRMHKVIEHDLNYIIGGVDAVG